MWRLLSPEDGGETIIIVILFVALWLFIRSLSKGKSTFICKHKSGVLMKTTNRISWCDIGLRGADKVNQGEMKNHKTTTTYREHDNMEYITFIYGNRGWLGSSLASWFEWEGSARRRRHKTKAESRSYRNPSPMRDFPSSSCMSLFVQALMARRHFSCAFFPSSFSWHTKAIVNSSFCCHLRLRSGWRIAPVMLACSWVVSSSRWHRNKREKPMTKTREQLSIRFTI